MSKPLIAITGASSGIGQATAELFSKAGYPLLLMARRLERLDALNLPNTITRCVDVTNAAEVKNAISYAEKQCGPIDCLINNAGIALAGPTQEQQPEEWQSLFNTNVMGVLNGIHAVLPSMIEKRQGTIINISSIAGRRAASNLAAYCGSKFAVHAITEGLRQETAAHNIRLSVIAPGIVETEIFDQGVPEAIKTEFLKLAIKPQAIAEAILFAYQLPQSVCMREIVIAPTIQER